MKHNRITIDRPDPFQPNTAREQLIAAAVWTRGVLQDYLRASSPQERDYLFKDVEGAAEGLDRAIIRATTPATANPSKADEIEALKDFAASRPRNSYLALMFADALPEIERAIASDYTPTPHKDLDAARAQLEALRTEIKRAQGDLTDRTTEARNACAELAAARAKLRTLADDAADLSKTARHHADRK